MDFGSRPFMIVYHGVFPSVRSMSGSKNGDMQYNVPLGFHACVVYPNRNMLDRSGLDGCDENNIEICRDT